MWIFRPSRSDRVVDAAITFAQVSRTVLGVLATVWLIYLSEGRLRLPDVDGNQLLFGTVVLVVGGPLSVTALSAWELRRLRTHHNITIRQALNRE